jgi:hypothetical protein
VIPRTAWQWIGTILGLSGPVDRLTYAITGVTLTLLKYSVEAAVLRKLMGRRLELFDFVSPSFITRSALLEGAPEWLGWAFVVWSLPFIWIALSMSVRRAAAAGISPWLGVTVLIPVANFLMMLILAVLPDKPAAATPEAPPPPAAPPMSLEDFAAVRAVLAALLVGGVTFVTGVYAFKTYGAVLFFGTPLVMGMVAGFLVNRPVVRSMADTSRVGVLVMGLAGGVLMAFALEGAICLVMAAPIVMPLSIAGALLGKWIAEATNSSFAGAVPLVLLLPLLSGAESLVAPLPEYVVLTTVEVDAPPEAVWPHVVEFPDLDPPTDWFFRCGIACPLRARIEGTGPGAVRHCEFTTGDFVEPITVWDEPWRLAFDVTSQPDPMVELSPWRHVHPPHLHDQSLRSRRGEFRLVDLGDGRTRLEGRTWYTFAMYPQAYWTVWSDFTIHRIHRRVLDHVKRLAERGG